MSKISMPKFFFVVVAAFWLPPAHAQNASFDCTKAASSIEKMICSDPELSDLDREMVETYQLIGSQNDLRKYKAPQLAWLKERNQCTDVACLKDKYLIRIGVLQAWAEKGLIDDAKPYVPRVIGDEPGAAVCGQFISEYDFSIKSLKHPLKWARVPEDKLSDPSEDYGWVHYMDVDIDNDGVKERLYRYVSSISGFKAYKDIEIVPLDESTNTEKVNYSALYKKSIFHLKSDWNLSIQKINKPFSAEVYQVAAYDHRSNFNPFFINGVSYIYLANESSKLNERFYLVVNLENVSGKIVSKEICHIEFK